MHRRGKRGIIQIRVGGRRQSSGTADKERAKILEIKLNNEAWDTAHGLIVPSWDQALLKWLKSHPKLAQKTNYKNFARWWQEHLTGKRLVTITPEAIHDIISENRTISLDSRIKQNSTANQYVDFVKRIIRSASNLNPEFQIYPPKLGNDRWITVEAWLKIAKHLTPDELDILTWLLATGQREANAMFFEWKWDHGTWGTVPAADTKTAVPYGIPYNRTVQTIMERRRNTPIKHVRYVFNNEGKAWYRNALLRALARACKAAGVPYITVHGLRHSFGTWLAKAGVPREIRKRLMAHSNTSTHDTYIHFEVDDLRPHVDIIDQLLAGTHSSQRKFG